MQNFTSHVGEPELHVRFLELWPKEDVTRRNCVLYQHDEDMVQEKAKYPDRNINLDRNVFFPHKDGECKVPTRYVVSPISPQKLNISAKWYNLVIEGAEPLEYLVL
jgi:hypothetical protein